jgi:hypothetical protein
MYTFDQVEVNLLTPAETKFLHNIADVLPENITTNKSISEYRREKQKHKDTVNKNYKEMTDDEIDQSAELIELSRSFKIIEVL